MASRNSDVLRPGSQWFTCRFVLFHFIIPSISISSIQISISTTVFCGSLCSCGAHIYPLLPKGRKRSCQKLCGWWGAPRRSHSVSLASVTCCWLGAIYGSMSQAGGKWIYVNLITHDNFKGTIMILMINYGLFFFAFPLVICGGKP